MTEENKQRVKTQIAKDNKNAEYGYEWHIIDGLLGEQVSSLVWRENCELIYVDMDGNPNKCIARYDENIQRFIGVSEWLKGNYMCSVIAYRRIRVAKASNRIFKEQNNRCVYMDLRGHCKITECIHEERVCNARNS